MFVTNVKIQSVYLAVYFLAIKYQHLAIRRWNSLFILLLSFRSNTEKLLEGIKMGKKQVFFHFLQV